MKIGIGFLILFILSSCNTNPEPITIGKDQCVHCKMAIMDIKYAAEIITSKGKIVKFDDIQCMKNYIQSNQDQLKTNSTYLVSDYAHPVNLISAETADFYQSEMFQTPMGGHIIGVSKNTPIPSFVSQEPIKKLSWSDIKK